MHVKTSQFALHAFARLITAPAPLHAAPVARQALCQVQRSSMAGSLGAGMHAL